MDTVIGAKYCLERANLFIYTLFRGIVNNFLMLKLTGRFRIGLCAIVSRVKDKFNSDLCLWQLNVLGFNP